MLRARGHALVLRMPSVPPIVGNPSEGSLGEGMQSRQWSCVPQGGAEAPRLTLAARKHLSKKDVRTIVHCEAAALVAVLSDGVVTLLDAESLEGHVLPGIKVCIWHAQLRRLLCSTCRRPAVPEDSVGCCKGKLWGAAAQLRALRTIWMLYNSALCNQYRTSCRAAEPLDLDARVALEHRLWCTERYSSCGRPHVWVPSAAGDCYKDRQASGAGAVLRTARRRQQRSAARRDRHVHEPGAA